VKGIDVVQDPDSASPQPLEQKPDRNYETRISGREALKIEFCQKNPVLFTYSAGQLETTPLPDVAAINQFVAAIKAAGVSLAAVARSTDPNAKSQCMRGEPRISAANGIAFSSLQELHKLTELFAAITSDIDLTRNPRSEELAKRKAVFAAQLDAVLPMRSLIASLHKYAVARSTAGQIPIQLEPSLEFVSGYGSVEQLRRSLKNDECLGVFTAAIAAQLDTWDFAASERDTLAAMLDTLEAFSTAFQSVGEDKTAAIVRYDSKNRQSQPLTIAANPEFAKLFSSATKQFVADASKVGTIKINVEPQLTWRPQIAPGVIYSFVKQPKFATSANGSGGFTIVQSESDYAAASGMIALNLTHDKYMRENVRPFFQIGISPKKDELAFLLGGGIALDDANKSVLSFGAIYQERDKLAPGLSVGGTLASADDLKTDTEFKFGFYVGISYNILPSK
jgi:hypothetical protein